jgi:hypothetical protein
VHDLNKNDTATGQLPNGFYPTFALGLVLYVLFAWADTRLTLIGIQGDLALEGNPIMRFMMETFGPLAGLVIQKGLVGLLASLFTLITAWGIHHQRPWVYSLAFFPLSRSWMRRQRRYWVAFSVLYLTALAQGLAAASWAYLLYLY